MGCEPSALGCNFTNVATKGRQPSLTLRIPYLSPSSHTFGAEKDFGFQGGTEDCDQLHP